jgi:hypothetical protein
MDPLGRCSPLRKKVRGIVNGYVSDFTEARYMKDSTFQAKPGI